jgi:HSP20 family protein
MPGTLTRWEPFSELTELRTRFDRLLDEWMDGRERVWTPAIDVMRKDHELILRADTPGFKPEEVKIEVEDDILTVVGEHTEQEEHTDEEYVRRERRYGSFARSVRLPERVDAKKIKATTHDGIIEVMIPLPAESKQPPVTITPTAG